MGGGGMGGGDGRWVGVGGSARVYRGRDAKTGAPVQSELASVTVIAGDCAVADAYATAAMAMGFDEAFAWLQSTPQVEAVFILRTGVPDEYEQRWSEGALALKRR